MDGRHAAQVVVVRVEARSRLVLGALELGLLQLGCNRANNARGYLVLQVENVRERAIESIGPRLGPSTYR